MIAFANCEGGKLYIGVQDDGTVIGLDNPDETALQVSNMIRDIYTNLGLLLSDQCVHTIKAAVFEGISQTTCGRLLKQMIENGQLVQAGKGKSFTDSITRLIETILKFSY